MSELTVAVVGAGGRGVSHARRFRRNGNARIVAVAEPDRVRRERFVAEHDVRASLVFASWQDLAEHPRCADAALITTQDAMHADPAVRLAELGYHLVVEKPLAPTEAESERIVRAARSAGVILAVAHVLRYAPYTQLLKRILADGRIGSLVTIQNLEPIGHWHAAHSYVRGSWSRTRESGPLLLTKSSHDIDLLGYLMGRRAVRVASFGSRTVFRSENRPAAASDRCLDCAVEPDCAYSAPRLYLGCLGDPERERWPLGAVTATPTREAVLEALRIGPYGLCVYGGTGSDVVDHQVVMVEYDAGRTATHTVTAFTEFTERKTRLFGSAGCIDGDGTHLRITDFLTGRSEVVSAVDDAGMVVTSRHGGGDQRFVDAVVRAVCEGDPSHILTGPDESLESHRVVWAAERARISGTVVTLPIPALPPSSEESA